MNLTAIDIRKMEFKGRPITSLIPLFGWRNDDIHTPI
jgi:hypothetical protein